MSIALGLLASLLWGTSDYLGGTASRRLPVTHVLFGSQLAAVAVLLPLAALTGGAHADRGYVVPAVAAGLIGLLALGAFFRALAEGTMGVVAPVASLGVAVPVLVGLARGESPSLTQVVGMLVAVGGVVVACGPELSAGRRGAGRRVLLLACGAAVGFGAVVALVAVASRGTGAGRGVPTVVMVLLTMRLASLAVLGSRLLALRLRHRPAAGADRVRTRPRDLLVLGTIGLFDAGANGAFALASRAALVSVVSVLASLYPVVTLLLARRFHHERLRRLQLTGVATALVGVATLSAG